MDKVYIVEAHFEDFESSWWLVVGLFNNKLLAEECSNKWSNFFESNQKIFDQPEDFKPKSYKDWGSDMEESWEESEDFYSLISKYDDIRKFTEVTINEFNLNQDSFVDRYKNYNKPQPLINLMKQWDRDYKINQLT